MEKKLSSNKIAETKEAPSEFGFVINKEAVASIIVKMEALANTLHDAMDNDEINRARAELLRITADVKGLITWLA